MQGKIPLYQSPNTGIPQHKIKIGFVDILIPNGEVGTAPVKNSTSFLNGEVSTAKMKYDSMTLILVGLLPLSSFFFLPPSHYDPSLPPPWTVVPCAPPLKLVRVRRRGQA
jgi:hypothetical protein